MYNHIIRRKLLASHIGSNIIQILQHESASSFQKIKKENMELWSIHVGIHV